MDGSARVDVHFAPEPTKSPMNAGYRNVALHDAKNARLFANALEKSKCGSAQMTRHAIIGLKVQPELAGERTGVSAARSLFECVR